MQEWFYFSKAERVKVHPPSLIWLVCYVTKYSIKKLFLILPWNMFDEITFLQLTNNAFLKYEI